MALTSEQWDALQQRAVNPFRSNESNAVNRLTRVLTLGDDVVLEDEKAELISNTTVRVLGTHYIKDDVYIHFKEDVDIDFTDFDNYLSLTDKGMDRAGVYFLVLHYVYNESIPFPIARFKILKNLAELTEASLLVCNANIIHNEDTNAYEIESIDFRQVPTCAVTTLRSGDFVNIPFTRLSGLAIEPSAPEANSVYFNGGRIVDKDTQKIRFLDATTFGTFEPVTEVNKKRYDLITVSFDGVLHQYKGEEFPASEPVNNCLMAMPYGEYPLAFVTVTEIADVIINRRDIIDVRSFLSTTEDTRNDIIALLDMCARLIIQREELDKRLTATELKIEFNKNVAAESDLSLMATIDTLQNRISVLEQKFASIVKFNQIQTTY